jgi:hypothetical protein
MCGPEHQSWRIGHATKVAEQDFHLLARQGKCDKAQYTNCQVRAAEILHRLAVSVMSESVGTSQSCTLENRPESTIARRFVKPQQVLAMSSSPGSSMLPPNDP